MLGLSFEDKEIRTSTAGKMVTFGLHSRVSDKIADGVCRSPSCSCSRFSLHGCQNQLRPFRMPRFSGPSRRKASNEPKTGVGHFFFNDQACGSHDGPNGCVNSGTSANVQPHARGPKLAVTLTPPVDLTWSPEPQNTNKAPSNVCRDAHIAYLISRRSSRSAPREKIGLGRRQSP